MQRERPVSEQPKKRKGLKANYQGATPEEVARAVLRYRPGKKKQQAQEQQVPRETTRAKGSKERA